MPLFLKGKSLGKFGIELIFIVLLILLCLFLFWLRSLHLDRLSLWMDEGFYVLAAQQILHYGYPLYPSGHTLFKGILYSYLLAFFGWLFGPGALTFRLISVVASVLVLPLFYLLARKIVSPALAFIGTVILAFSSWETEYARVAIYFSLLQLIYLACLYFFHLTYLEGKKKYLWLTVILFILAPHIHQLAMGTFFSFLALFFIFGFRRFFRRDVIWPMIIISASYLLLQLHELFFWKVGYVYEKEPGTLKEGLNYFFQGFTFAYFREILLSFPRMGLLVLVSFFLYLGLRLVRHFLDSGEKIFLDRWFFYLINFLLPLVFFGFFRTHVQPRYLFQLHPLLVLLFLVAIREISKAILDLFLEPFSIRAKPWFQKLLVALICFIFIILLSDQVSWSTTQRIVNRDYKDRITTDIIFRSGRTEHYDHQGIGRYVQHYLQPEDIVVAMHMVFQYIYGGGKVDYWLWTGGPGTWDAWEKTAEGWKDVYVGARWINSLDALQKLIAERGERRLWLVATPSLYKQDHINQEVANYILSQKERLVFRGRDGLSGVYLWVRPSEEQPARKPIWEAEWLPASLGKIKFDPAASRGSYLHFSKSQAVQMKKNIPWKNDLPPGEYNLRVALRTEPEEKGQGGSYLEINLRMKKTNLLIFSKIIRSKDLPPGGDWRIFSSKVNLPQAEELWLSLSFQGEKAIDWDYLDFEPLDSQFEIQGKRKDGKGGKSETS